jgi:NAD(P)-dependent dehydrogenase (short-subunit alcohol dehydrogenase family)
VGVLDGKAVVVTGAGRGLGASYAHLAAQQGAAVIVNDIVGELADRVAGEIRAAGFPALAHVADVSDWAQAGETLERCVVEFGALDGLVNNAGLYAMNRIQEVEDPDDLRRMLDANVIGTYACGAQAARRMVAQGFGVIVNVSSSAACGMSAGGAYAATKGAVSSLTYSWAEDLRDTGVRVNAICPRGLTRMAVKYHDYFGLPFDHRAEAEASHIEPDANAAVVVYLLSSLSENVNGQIVRIVGDELALFTHPFISEPSFTQDEWTIDDVAKTFAAEFADRLMPLGIARGHAGDFGPEFARA